MATESEHLAQARENLNLAQRLDRSAWIGRQWACTMFFYTGVHCVEAAHVSTTPSTIPAGDYGGKRHDWREAWMDLNAIPALASGYKKLRIASNRARYNLVKTSEADLQVCEAGARAILTRSEAHQLPVRP